MGLVVGIDLGTTNSAVASLEGTEPVIIANAEGSRTTPSVVAFAKNGDVLVGEVAKRQAVTNPERTLRSVKRHIGSNWCFNFDGQDFTAQEISARTLMKLKADAEAYLGQQVTDAVVTVPAYFTDAQRQATKEAGVIAGLNIMRIINEPTAAALAYELRNSDQEMTVLVFDLGGGTFDVSLLDIGDGVVEVRATSGDNDLGGDDWDARVVQFLRQRFESDHGVDLSADKMAMQRLFEAAEKAKIELSSLTQTDVSLPYLTATAEGPLHLEYTITRSQLEEITADLLDRTRNPVLQVLSDAGVDAGEVDRVVLVGGSTRMPAVSHMVRDLTGKEPSKDVNPDEVVALGAALQAGVLRGDVKEVLLLDVTPLSLGIETKGGVMTTLIPRNTSIPVRRTETFTTAEDNQSSVLIQVYQGEREMVEFNRHLGKFELTGLPPAPRGVPQVDVTFSIDANGIASVHASDHATGRQQSITVTSSSLTSEQVEEMVRAAGEFRDQDAKRKAEAQLRNDADALIYRADKFLHDFGDKLGEYYGEVRSAADAVASCLGQQDVKELRSAHSQLSQVLHSASSWLYSPDEGSADSSHDASQPDPAEPAGQARDLREADEDGDLSFSNEDPKDVEDSTSESSR